MAVRIVTDSSAGLPPEIVEELDITVVDLHVLTREVKDSIETTTSGLSTLELVAAYARQLERGGDDGVVALHVPGALSSTESSAIAAAAVFDGLVEVVQTSTVGMAIGAAAMAAAKCAQQGEDLASCAETARATLARAVTWVYLHKIDDIRRGGRLSTGQAMLSAATLATKPIMQVTDGRLELVGKTRTQTKAFTKLVELVAERADHQPAFVAIQHNDAPVAAEDLRDLLDDVLTAETSFMVIPMSEALAVHAGTGAVGVSAVFAAESVDNSESDGD
ncbi:fatty acid-binding protein DegV [Corynebacterium yudongzhengii]|uniref:DegV family EDD domain-containing protein n=1 Tax=Corynebacterium yudongzhengii TaxID=2080740 RepID=A0A2U1T909_9CORY|nr:DegV family protein [Corynebacterium yudongzhengii]AWB82445.1 fatty acid-binding protein DegV [Corynebacterium yudongzhengii]PWC02500.1 DegV family EDD domain-containing protein [Corynebacterium yudongzhengii]